MESGERTYHKGDEKPRTGSRIKSSFEVCDGNEEEKEERELIHTATGLVAARLFFPMNSVLSLAHCISSSSSSSSR